MGVTWVLCHFLRPFTSCFTAFYIASFLFRPSDSLEYVSGFHFARLRQGVSFLASTGACCPPTTERLNRSFMNLFFEFKHLPLFFLHHFFPPYKMITDIYFFVPAGGSPHEQPQGSSQSFGGPSNEQSYGSIDFSGSMYGGMGSVSAMGGSISSVSSSSNLNVPTMNMSSHYTSSGLTNSPMMLPTDDTTFSGGYVAAAQQQHMHYVSRPSRSGSGSTSSSTPSSGSHLQLASGIPHSGSTVAASTFSDALMDQSLVEPHLRYHFENVLPMQYVFGSDKAHGILQSVCTPIYDNVPRDGSN